MDTYILRQKIYDDVREAISQGKEVTLEYKPDNPTSFRATLVANLRKRGLTRTKVRTHKDSLYVIVTAPTREERLEALVRKAMFHIDDESLYDEAMEVLYGNSK